MPGPFVGSLGPFRPTSMVDQIHIDVGIKGRITSPKAQIRWHERDRASWYCLASDCRGKKLAATADCNNPVNFSRVSNIDQRAALPSRHTAAITARPASIGEREFDSAPTLSHRGQVCPIHKQGPYHLTRRRGLVVPSVSRVQRCENSAGFEYWTLRCIRCGLIYEAQVAADPMKSDAVGREHSHLRGPQ
jgi:hypothetical protein